MESDGIWERGWEGHKRAQLLRLSRVSFREKLEWLEEAQEMVEEFKRQQGQKKRSNQTPRVER